MHVFLSKKKAMIVGEMTTVTRAGLGKRNARRSCRRSILLTPLSSDVHTAKLGAVSIWS